MKICQPKDFDFVYAFFSRDDFVGDITDDLSPNLSDAVKTMLDKGLVLMPTNATAFVLSPINSTLGAVHLNTTEEDKQRVYTNTLRTTWWVKNNTNFTTFLAYIPSNCEATLYYAKKIGMNQIGVVPNGILKNNTLVDIVIMSASVETIIGELLWHQ